MPYIKNKRMRISLNHAVNQFLYYIDPTFTKKNLKGNLNYFLFKLAKEYCKNYADFSDFIGELECSKDEIQRRLLHPYEDKKIKENGDVE